MGMYVFAFLLLLSWCVKEIDASAGDADPLYRYLIAFIHFLVEINPNLLSFFFFGTS